LKVACWVPVAVSPETCDSPADDSEANAAGMLPLALKKFVSPLPTLRWLTLTPGVDPKSSAKLRKTWVAS
jgi:hypothetical protein